MKDKSSSILDVLLKAERLKKVRRKGWITKAKIRNAESVAEHSYCVALAAMLVADIYSIDFANMLRTAIIHDLCEVMTGDIQPDEMSRKEKHLLEMEALKKILDALPEDVKGLYLRLFREFNSRSTPVAKLVSEIDKLEMAIQASIYEKEKGLNLDEFFLTARSRINSHIIRDIYDNLMRK
ncbi:MAG: HD domain-containing protein [Conexivisphaerales archaeon]